jgi:hypothetical protein
MQALPIILLGGAGLMTAAADIGQGYAAKRLSKNNAKMARQQAESIRQAGDLEAARHMIRVGALIEDQRAAFAAQGLDPNLGSAMDVQQDTHTLGLWDEAMIRHNAAMKAWGLDNEANMSEATGKFQYTQGWLKAGSDLMAAGAKGASMWVDSENAGAKGRGKGGGTALSSDFTF